LLSLANKCDTLYLVEQYYSLGGNVFMDFITVSGCIRNQKTQQNTSTIF